MVARDVLEALASGAIDVERALATRDGSVFATSAWLPSMPIASSGRKSPEVIFGEGKTAEQIVTIARALLDAGQNVLVTRIDKARADALANAFELTTCREPPASRASSRSLPSRRSRAHRRRYRWHQRHSGCGGGM
jgi:NCAIR mutase (PurE)-related protein